MITQYLLRISSSKASKFPSPSLVQRCSQTFANSKRVFSFAECLLFKKCIIKTIIEFGLRMISRSIKPRDCVICLSLKPRQITTTTALIIHEILRLHQQLAIENFSSRKPPFKITVCQNIYSSVWLRRADLSPTNKGNNFLKGLWCCVSEGQNKIIQFFPLS